MVDRYLSVKCGVINPLDGFRENDIYGRTTDARTTDVHVRTVALLCSSTKQSSQQS